MLALYKRKRIRAPILRHSTFEKYLISPMFGAVCATSLHYYNWMWFKQKNIYDMDGTEKDTLWRRLRGEEFYRHFNLATNILGIGVFTYAIVKFRRKFIFSPRGGNPIVGFGYMLSQNILDYAFGLPVGGLPVELIYYSWHIYDTKTAEREELGLE